MRMEGRSGLEHVKKIRTNASVNHRHSAMVGPDLFLIKIDLSPLTGNNVHEPMSALCAVFTSFKTELNCCSETAQRQSRDLERTWRQHTATSIRKTTELPGLQTPHEAF
ncbi:hypothetical protein E3U43_000585 [Larimichthys crocea]|uniref:Uncharacterized protein n=1 Tax=Larimichthys crocea TaxID=215358 RepID=A0ACD3Q912_LARCR|nr:hypothetical protein E3U43_000585 [Larimichthys crocea]